MRKEQECLASERNRVQGVSLRRGPRLVVMLWPDERRLNVVIMTHVAPWCQRVAKKCDGERGLGALA